MSASEPLNSDKFSFQLRSKLVAGEYTFALHMADVLGNETRQQWKCQVEEQAP